MYKVIVNYKNGENIIFIRQDYDIACALVNEIDWNSNVKSIQVKEVK